MPERTQELHTRLLLTALLFVLPLLTFSSSLSAATVKVDEKLLAKEMKFIEKIAKAGYFEAARAARDRAKDLPGLTQAQKTYLDLVQAKIDVQEIVKEKDLAAREDRLSKSIDFLNGLVEKLPNGSILRVQAGAKLIMTYVEVAETGQADLAKMAQAAHEKAAEGADPVRRDMLTIFDNLIDRMGMIDDPKRMQFYLKQLEVIFVAMEEFDHAVAAMYPNWGLTYPRGSEDRKKIFEKGYWYNTDVSEIHAQAYQDLPNYVDYNMVMTKIRLGSLMDQPYELLAPKKNGDKDAPEVVENLLANIPAPLTLMSRSFKEEVIGKFAGKTVEVGQEARPRCLYYFGLGWLDMAKGAYALLDKAGDDAKKKRVYTEYAEKMIAGCDKVLEEFEKEKSVVGPIPDFVKEAVEMDLRIPLLLLQAQRAFKEKNKSGAKAHLSYAKGTVGNMLLDPDPMRKQAAQRRMVVVKSIIDDLVPELNKERTAAEAIFEAERIHKAYRAAKLRKAPKKDVNELLANMRERFMEAKTLLTKSKLPRKIRAEYGSKCWYYIGLSSLYLGDYYEAFIANQHILQAYREVRYPAARYPQLERYRGFAARNVVTAAYKQHKVTKENYDRALYADSIIWRLSYESSAPSPDGKSKENVDFYYVVGENFLKSRQFEKALYWFAKVPETSKLYRLSFLQRGQANLKKALTFEDEAKKLVKKAAKITKTQPDEAMEMEAAAGTLREEAKPWYKAAAEASQRFISEHEKYAARFADGKEEMPLHQKVIFGQEARNKFAGFLLLMQVEFGAENWDNVLSWAERLTEDSVPESMRGAVLPVSNLMHFLAIIKKIDIEKDPVADLATKLNKAQEVRSLIGKYAEADDPTALQAIMVQGDHWLKLAGRAKGDETKAKEYRLKAGEAFVEAIEVVDKNVNFAIVMGPIFTEQGMYDKAEAIYDRAIEKWDTDEKRPPMPLRKEVEFAAKSIDAKYLGQSGQMKDLHTDLKNLLFPKDRNAQPEDLLALAKINQIVEEAKKMNVPGVPELPTKDLMARLKTAVRFRNTMLRVKSGLILAKADSQKWDEAMKLADDVLKISKGDKRIQLLKATVHIRRAEKAGDLAKATADLTTGSKMIAKLTFNKKDKFIKFSAPWWDAMALFYEANKIKYLYAPKGATAVKKVPSEMRMIKMWQGGRTKPSELFMDRTNAVYAAYQEAGFKEKQLNQSKMAELDKQSAAGKERLDRLQRQQEGKAQKKRASMINHLSTKAKPEERKQYMLRQKTEAPAMYEAYWREFPKKMEEWGLPKPPPEKKEPEAKKKEAPAEPVAAK
ncbi:MAG: hypothetical protein ACYTGH_12900 [Planctomycetota bacterium]